MKAGWVTLPKGPGENSVYVHVDIKIKYFMEENTETVKVEISDYIYHVILPITNLLLDYGH